MEYQEDATGGIDLGKISFTAEASQRLGFLSSVLHMATFLMNILSAVPLVSGYQVGLQCCCWTDNYTCVNWHTSTKSFYAFHDSYPCKEESSWKKKKVNFFLIAKSQAKKLGDDGSRIAFSHRSNKMFWK